MLRSASTAANKPRVRPFPISTKNTLILPLDLRCPGEFHFKLIPLLTDVVDTLKIGPKNGLGWMAATDFSPDRINEDCTKAE